MVKVHTIEMFEHSAKNFPNVVAHEDFINGSLVGLGDGVTTAPATGKPVYVVINQQVGDDEYKEDYKILKGQTVNLFDLTSWADKELDITESNVVLGDGEKFADLVKGTELTFDAATLKFKKGTSTAGDVGFVVESKWGQITNGITVKIVIK